MTSIVKSIASRTRTLTGIAEATVGHKGLTLGKLHRHEFYQKVCFCPTEASEKSPERQRILHSAFDAFQCSPHEFQCHPRLTAAER